MPPLPSWRVFLTLWLVFTVVGAVAMARWLARMTRDEPLPGMRRRVTTALVRAGVLAALCLAVALTAWSSLEHLAGNPLIYHEMLIALPLAAQGGIGLLLLLVASWLTGLLVLQTFPSPRARAVFALGALTVVLVHPLLPIHLSAPDFDDFFTVDKFIGSISPAWLNTKPDFCLSDFLYRIGDLCVDGVAADRLERFRINAWFAVLYAANVAIVLQTALRSFAARQLGRRQSLFAGALALSWLGPVVLSHTLAYELAGATFFLLAFNSLEALRTRAVDGRCAAIGVVLVLALGLTLQALNFDASSVCWAVVYVHGLLVLRDLRAPRLERLAGGVALLAGAWLVLGRDPGRYVDPADLSKFQQMLDYLQVTLPIAVVLGVTWFSAGGRDEITAFFRSLRAGTTRATAIALYFVGGFAIYLHANQGKFGLLFPNRRRGFHWDYATNHARYAAFFFPFLCVAWAWALLRHPRLTPRVRLLLLAASWLAWNEPYILEFYADSGEVAGQHAPYRANDRTMTQLAGLLAPRDPSEVLGYLPIPRDHADHFLLRALWPQAAFTDICRAREPSSADLTVVLSWHTLDVLRENGVTGSIWRADVRPPDLRREVWLVQRSQFAADWLNAWCGHFDRGEWICL